MSATCGSRWVSRQYRGDDVRDPSYRGDVAAMSPQWHCKIIPGPVARSFAAVLSPPINAHMDNTHDQHHQSTKAGRLTMIADLLSVVALLLAAIKIYAPVVLSGGMR